MIPRHRAKNTAYSVLLAVTMFISPHTAMADSIKNMEDAHVACLKDSIGDDATFNRCAGEEIEQLEKLSRVILKELISKYSTDEENKSALLHVQKEQKAWEAYEKMACNNLSDFLIYGTSGRSIYFPGCRSRVIKQRIQTLHEELCAGEWESPKYCK